MNIESMKSHHVSQVAALEKLCFLDPWSENSISSELDNPLSYWLVATQGEVVTGYVGSQTVLGESDMMNLAVHPDFRRQGIAELLVKALVQALTQQGSQCLTLEVRVSNQAAHGLYRKLGFVPIGRRPRYYCNPKEDADILRLVFDIGKDVTA